MHCYFGKLNYKIYEAKKATAAALAAPVATLIREVTLLVVKRVMAGVCVTGRTGSVTAFDSPHGQQWKLCLSYGTVCSSHRLHSSLSRVNTGLQGRWMVHTLKTSVHRDKPHCFVWCTQPPFCSHARICLAGQSAA